MRLSSRKRSSKGDTIVEVLITIAIISSVLAGAFSVTQKSAMAVRDSQERSEMLQILQGQVELVRSIAVAAPTPTHEIFETTPQYFCIDSASKAKREFSASASLNNLGDYHADCKDLGAAGLYRLAVSYNSTTSTYTFIGNWDNLGGGNNSMKLSYRIAPTP